MYAEDSERDETLLQICKVEYKTGDRLFMTRILLEPTAEQDSSDYVSEAQLNDEPIRRKIG